MARLRMGMSALALAGLAALGPPAAQAVSVSSGQGVAVSQVDYTHPGASQSFSTTGLLTIDYAALATATSQSSGYLNVYDGAGNWLVQNVPVNQFAPIPGVSTMFDLTGLGVTNGTPASPLSLDVQYDLAPTATGAPTFGTSVFVAGTVANNAQGFGAGGRAAAPAAGPNPLLGAFNALGQTLITYYTGHPPSIEQDVNQCAPAAVANSLQFLENTTPLVIDQPHVPGDNTSPADASIVGELDKDMGRAPGQTVGALPILNGKLQYESDEWIGDRVQTKHQGLLGGGNVNNAGQTSIGHGATVTAQWILDELADGEDVELGIFWDGGGGHFVEVIGGGTILGVPWIAFNHDADQGNAGGTGLLDGGYGFSFLRDTDNDGTLNFYNYLDGSSGEIVFAVSESFIPSPAALPAGLAMIGLLVARRRR